MKHLTSTLFLIFIGMITIHAQSFAKLHLWSRPVIVPGQDFIIEKVMDGRKDKSSIGTVKLTVFDEVQPARFEGGLENDIYTLLRDNMYRFSNLEPVIMRITFLNISETSGYRETGRAEMQAEFYKIKGDSVGKVFVANAFAEDVAKNVYTTHETRIRKVITDCLIQFCNSDWENVNPDWILLEKLKLINSDTDANSFPFHKALEKIPRTQIYQFNALKGTAAAGFQFQFTSFSDTLRPGQLFFPATFLLSISEYKPYSHESTYTFYAGTTLPLMFKVSNQSYLNLQAGLGIGIYRYTTGFGEISDASYTPYLMIMLDQSYMFIPAKESGCTFSMGVYEHFCSGDILDTDFGIKLSIGIKSMP